VEADILVRNPRGESILVAEIKNRQNLSPSVATALRRNLAAHNLLPPAAYFLLASQDFGYLWRAADLSLPDTPPTAQFPMSDVIARYLPSLGPHERLRETELELLVLMWLQDLAGSTNKSSLDPEGTLATTGLLEALRGSTVYSHATS
jgi:hypothetical protein